ncbi:polynucleotide kinase-phosphatase [bacterium]|nr:MAG: polynucleotide kinase-phosphatase [bacterium]
MSFEIPRLSLVLLVGASGCGKSTFGRKHFLPTEVVSSDFCRGLVADDENDQSATPEAFDLLFTIVRKRLAAGRLTVVDATNVQEVSRKALLAIAKEYHVPAVALVFKVDESVCQERNAERPDRQFGPHVVRNQIRDLRRSMGNLRKEGFRAVYWLNGVEEVDAATIDRVPEWNDRRFDHGPFDIVGDVHGCLPELLELLAKLGYVVEESSVEAVLGELRHGRQLADLPISHRVFHPEGRRLVFVGDLVDRGPDTPGVLKIAMSAVAQGTALCVPGNHDVKLMRALKGAKVSLSHGLKESLEQLEAETEEFRGAVKRFIDGLVSHYVLDDGKLVVAHAGMKGSMIGRASARVRDFALYGETTGETDEFGLPVRYPWAADYRGSAKVVYGHTPVPNAEWINGTIDIDTGCVFGGKLTALRYPSMEVVDVPAAREYAEPIRPLVAAVAEITSQQALDDTLDLADVSGKRIVQTRLRRSVTIPEENGVAALEVMSRFAADPKWLIYLPPTMSPSETTRRPGLLEHPDEAIGYYRHHGVPKVVLEEKHMGSRAVVVVCRDVDAARARFGVVTGETGAVLTRTGRKFFNEAELEAEFLKRVAGAVGPLWDELETDWVLLDAELMPWSAKAMELLRTQYAPVGAAALAATSAAVAVSGKSPELAARLTSRQRDAQRYVEAYQRYCWPVNGLDDYRLAPFHLLASEGRTYFDRDHRWHMQTLARLTQSGDPLLMATPWREVDTLDPEDVARAGEWWNERTEQGGEGMVVKPLPFIAQKEDELLQPAVKCRGPEYLRIIYGPEYLEQENLDRLRKRGLNRKRSLALREFVLGVEAVERFVRREPLRRVHECVFGVLALESEPVDPRL